MKPLISDVTVTNITLTSATVNWVTDETADSPVKYGTESGNYTPNTIPRTSHRI
ncbi:MAG: hypothetical protein OCU22_04200 [Canidatus Methanoxibalbensis ujae]|nr:hypothetical protein [Candidatus Methanoxibalbensis ujae]